MSATISSPIAQRWLPQLLSGHPHQVIRTSAGDPYLLRWFLVPPNKYCQVYGQNFSSSGLLNRVRAVVLAGLYQLAHRTSSSGVKDRGSSDSSVLNLLAKDVDVAGMTRKVFDDE